MVGPRVLLVDEGWCATLHAARALERAGCAVTVVTANGSAARTRRRSVWWTSAPPVTSPGFLRAIDRAAARADHVLPLTEPVMRALWLAPPAWAARVHPRPAPWQQRLALDKHALIEHMAARGVDVPRHLRVDAALRVDDAIDALGLPLVVKAATGAAGVRVHVVERRAELVRALARARAGDDAWIVQELIAGPTCLVGGLFHDGRALRLYGAEKVEQFPPRTGPAIRLRSSADPALLAAGVRPLAELGWTGLASVDLVRRPDGRFALLEVNPRPWGSIAAARAAGVELFAPLAELLAGRAPAPALGFVAGDERAIFPRYLLAPAHRGPRGLARALRDVCAPDHRDWLAPRFFVHLIDRLVRLRRLAT